MEAWIRGEWKVMGLAPYGKPEPGLLKDFHPHYKDGNLVKTHDYTVKSEDGKIMAQIIIMGGIQFH